MAEETQIVLPQYLNRAQLDFITQKTPDQFVKKRPGPGGISLGYVEVGYVINILNQAFGWDWDFRILDQQIGKKQVWVRGELTVRLRSHSITKGQYGGSDIKMNRQSQPISIADDLKAAASDCLKKCASMLGIASDVYWKELESVDDRR
jgi:recombination DNA repair RAD52 pathway protein